MNNIHEYKKAMDSLAFTAEQKRKIAWRAACEAEAPVKPVKHSGRRIALIAACLVVVMAVGAVASGGLSSAGEVFGPLFGGTAAQTEVIDKIGRPIGASDTDNGITITADAILGDRYNACVVCTISRDDGTALLPEGILAQQLLVGGTGGISWSRGWGGTHGSAWFVDEVPGDDTVQFVQTVSSDSPLNTGTARAFFSDISYWDDKAGESVVLLEGNWDFRFDVDYEDSSVMFSGGETFEQNGMTFTVTDVSVSPVAVRVAYEVDSPVQWSNAESGRVSEEDQRQWELYFDSVELLVTKTDGTVMDLTYAGGSMGREGDKTVCVKSTVLREIVPMEELESVSVGGVTYTVNPKN